MTALYGGRDRDLLLATLTECRRRRRWQRVAEWIWTAIGVLAAGLVIGIGIGAFT